MYYNLKPPNLVVVNPYFKLLLLLPHTPFSRDPLITSTHTVQLVDDWTTQKIDLITRFDGR
jgi:hypothetical protein